MFIVKLTFNYEWPIFRQTPGNLGIWGDYKFVIDDNLKECDFWVVYSDYLLKDETVKCNPKNVIFIPAECYNTSPRFTQQFLDQFGTILTVQRELQHRNVIYCHNANPWFVNKSYDELKSMTPPRKTKLISVISSDKVITDGHRKRLDFIYKLKERFKDEVDVFGRGIVDFVDKWDVLADYKYSIAIENDNCDDWMTEKLIDCYLAYTFPIYYGCPNLERYMPSESYFRIDIDNIEESLNKIEEFIKEDLYFANIESISEARRDALDRENLFPILVRLLEQMNPRLPKEDFQFIANSTGVVKQPRHFGLKTIFKKIIKYVYD